MEALLVKREMEKGKRRVEKGEVEKGKEKRRYEKGEVEKERGRREMRKERWKRKLVR